MRVVHRAVLCLGLVCLASVPLGLVCLASVPLALVCLASVPLALAQDKPKPPSAAKRSSKPSKQAKHKKEAPPPPMAADTKRDEPAKAAPVAADSQENVHKEGGTEVKTLEFGGLDIEGQLKTPQMLYFLNRLRAEFDRPQLPHRSFMPELQRTTKEDVF
ncbi:MAG TPA: hypothetical protein VGI70_10090 [Polyangiales bacterium]|jgi:hypothetical protein